MKKVQKASLMILTVILMLAVIAAGCGKSGGSNGGSAAGGNNTSAGNAGNTAGEADGGASALKPYTIKMFVPGGAAQRDQALVNEEVSKYLKDKINASFELTVIDWGSWQDKMNLKFASSEPFDLMYTAAWDNYATKINDGSIIDLTDLIDKFAPDAKKVINPALLEGSKTNGKNFGMPINKEMASSRGLLLRKDLVEKYNIDISKIKTLADMEPIYETIKKNEPGVTPLYLNKDTSINSIMDAANFDSVGDGVGKIKREGTDFTVVNEVASDETKQVLALARKWYQAGYVNKDAATLADLQGGLKAGKAFSYYDMLKPGKDAEVSNATGVQWVQVELTKPITTTGDTTGAMTSISRTSKDPERAMIFLNLLYTDPYLVNLIAFGIEGKHYVKVAGKDNIIDFPSGVTGQTSGYNLNQPWLYGNQFNDYLWANEDPQKWEKFKQFNESAEISRVLGFTFNPEPVKNELAALANVTKEFGPGLYSGTLNPDEALPKFLDKIKSVGGDKIIAEKQKQLDEWVKSKQK